MLPRWRLPLVLLGMSLATSGLVARAATPRSTFVLERDPASDAGEARLREMAARLLGAMATFDEFHFSLSNDLLSRAIAPDFDLEAPFRDVLLGTPVRGQAQVAAHLVTRLVPHDERIVVELAIEGSVKMKGIGDSSGVRVHSDATTKFTAHKRLHFDRDGFSTTPTRCEADTSMTTTGIRSIRPRIIGKFAERIAERRVTDTRSQAEAECSEHVALAVRENLDQEFDRLAKLVNASLQAHLATLHADKRAHWNRLCFQTEEGRICIRRQRDAQAVLVAKRAENDTTPLLLAMPRAQLDATAAMVAMRVLGRTAHDTADISPFLKLRAVELRPTFQVNQELLTLALDYPPTTAPALAPPLASDDVAKKLAP